MISLDALIGLAGCLVTVLVIAGMILLTPRGVVKVHAEGTDPYGSNRSPTLPPDEPLPTRTAA